MFEILVCKVLETMPCTIVLVCFFLQMVESKIGTLHTPEVIEEFKKVGASEEVIKVLEQGLYMPYDENLIPKNKFFKNNGSFFEHQDFAIAQIKIWEKKGK